MTDIHLGFQQDQFESCYSFAFFNQKSGQFPMTRSIEGFGYRNLVVYLVILEQVSRPISLKTGNLQGNLAFNLDFKFS